MHDYLHQQPKSETYFSHRITAFFVIVSLLLMTIAWRTTTIASASAPASDNAPEQTEWHLFLPVALGQSVADLNASGDASIERVSSAQIAPSAAPPDVVNPGAQTNKINTVIDLQIEASDVDGDPLTYSATGLPPGLNIGSTSGLITGTITYAGSFGTTILVGDGLGGSTVAEFTWTVTPQNAANITNPGDQTAKVDDVVNLAISASDPDGDAITYTASGLPAGLSINGSTGVISGVPTTVGTYNVTVEVSDGIDPSSASFSWTIDPAGTAYIGDMVFLDRNGNGIHETGLGETGVDGVTVRLLDGGGTELESTVTSGGGRYIFDQLPAGTYIIAFVSNGMPFTTQHAGDGGLDSDANPSSGRTAPITLGDNVWMDWIDAGLAPNESLSEISGNVFEDMNRNGRFNSGEPAVSSVVIRLMSSSGVEAANVSSNGGSYKFTGIPSGSYSIVAESFDPAYAVASTPGSFSVCCGSRISNKDIAMSSTGISSGSGSTGGGDSGSTGGSTTPSTSASISGMAYMDLNQNGRLNTGEPGAASTEVRLLSSSGSTVATTYTDGSGNYSFANVDAGSYTVRFYKPSRTYRFTTSDRASVSVSSGQSQTGISAGLQTR